MSNKIIEIYCLIDPIIKNIQEAEERKNNEYILIQSAGVLQASCRCVIECRPARGPDGAFISPLCSFTFGLLDA